MTGHKHLPQGTRVYITGRKPPKTALWLGEILERLVVKTTPVGYKVCRPGGTAVDLRKVTEYFITENKNEAVQFCLDKVDAYIKREQELAAQAKNQCEEQIALANKIADALRATITCSEVAQ